MLEKGDTNSNRGKVKSKGERIKILHGGFVTVEGLRGEAGGEFSTVEGITQVNSYCFLNLSH